MKVNKLFGVKSITNLIYGLLLLAPFVAILSRVIYVQSNDYAKDSYYGDTINEFTIENPTYLDSDTIYTFDISNHVYNFNVGRFAIYYTPLEIIYNTSNIDFMSSNRVEIEAYTNQSNVSVITYWFYSSNEHLGTYYSNWDSTIRFTLYEITTNNEPRLDTYLHNTTDFSYKEYNKFSYLDNAFEYSLYTFVEENDVQSIDFFSWFTNLFLNQNNAHNALYLNFANWYLNYTLLVSSGYLLFFALMWFINYVRKMLEKSSYHDFGGF